MFQLNRGKCALTSAQNMIPFAVVGSERNVIIGGKAVRGRKNRWGVVNVEDETHCEFVSLRNFLTRYEARKFRVDAETKMNDVLQDSLARSHRDHSPDSL